MANSVDQMQHSVVADLGLYCMFGPVLLNPGMTCLFADNVDPYQLASEEAN